MVFNLNAVGLGECEDLKLSPEELVELEAARPAGSSSGGIPIPKTLCMSGLYEIACKMPHSCIPSCNCEAMSETPLRGISRYLDCPSDPDSPSFPAPPRPAPPRPAPHHFPPRPAPTPAA